MMAARLSDPAHRVLAAGLAYAVAYAAAVLLLPTPPPVGRVILADLFLFLPAAAAALLAARAARVSRDAERVFWTLLALAAASSASSQLLFALHDAWWTVPPLRTAAHVSYYGCIVMMAVSLLVRPERPRTLQQARWASLESLIAVLLGYFLVLYFVVLPWAPDRQPWYAVLLAQELLPAAWALSLGTRGAPTRFQRVYRTLGAAMLASALGSAWPNWLYTRGAYQMYSPWEAFWALPLVG